MVVEAVERAGIRNPVEVVGNNPVVEAAAGKHRTGAVVGTQRVVDMRNPLEVAGMLNWTQLEPDKP